MITKVPQNKSRDHIVCVILDGFDMSSTSTNLPHGKRVRTGLTRSRSKTSFVQSSTLKLSGARPAGVASACKRHQLWPKSGIGKLHLDIISDLLR